MLFYAHQNIGVKSSCEFDCRWAGFLTKATRQQCGGAQYYIIHSQNPAH
jgi:hypothetical protein